MSMTESPRPPNQVVQASMTCFPSSSVLGIPPPWYAYTYFPIVLSLRWWFLTRRGGARSGRLSEPGIATGVAALRHDGEPVEVVAPTLAMRPCGLDGRQVAMDEPQPRAAVYRFELDLDRRRPGRHQVWAVRPRLPAPRVHQSARPFELHESSARNVAGDDLDP